MNLSFQLSRRTAAIAALTSGMLFSIVGGHLQNISADALVFFGVHPDAAKEIGAVSLAAIAALLFLAAYRNRRKLLGVCLRDRRTERVPPAHCLIFFVSPPTGLVRSADGKDWLLHGSPLASAHPRDREDGDAGRERLDCLDREINAATTGKPQFVSQQILRGLRRHIKHVERVYLVGSNGPRGTHRAAEEIVAPFLRDCLGSHVAAVEVAKDAANPDGVDFERVEDVKDFLDRLVDREIARPDGVREHKIIVDVTGGLKTTSIAGAALTLERELNFQYVQTTSPWEIRHYDLEYVVSSESSG